MFLSGRSQTCVRKHRATPGAHVAASGARARPQGATLRPFLLAFPLKLRYCLYPFSFLFFSYSSFLASFLSTSKPFFLIFSFCKAIDQVGPHVGPYGWTLAHTAWSAHTDIQWSALVKSARHFTQCAIAFMSNKKLLGTSALLVAAGALLVVTRSY